MKPLSVEMTVLAASALLLFVQVLLQSSLSTREAGLLYNASPRDEELRPRGVVARRAARALANFQETYPIFLGLALALEATGRSGGLGATGAMLWLACRIAYVPLYLGGVILRSLVWALSILGLALMGARLVFPH